MDAKTKLKIDISLVANQLNAIAAFTPNEFSGVGFGKWDKAGTTFSIYRVEILDIGTHTWTEIRPEDLKWALTDPDLKNMKCWVHRHPMGSSIPGPKNWSFTDHNTARNEPLGAAFPPTSGWSCSIVLTPTGWTGRVDEYGPGKGTTYCEVVPNPIAEMAHDLKLLAWRAKGRYGRIAQGEESWDDFDSQDLDELDVLGDDTDDDDMDDLMPLLPMFM